MSRAQLCVYDSNRPDSPPVAYAYRREDGTVEITTKDPKLEHQLVMYDLLSSEEATKKEFILFELKILAQ